MLFDFRSFFDHVVAYLELRWVIWLEGFGIVLLERLRLLVYFGDHWRCTVCAEVTLIVLRWWRSRVPHQESKLFLV